MDISKVSKNQQKLFLNSNILKEYKHFLESLFLSSKYLLSDKEEKIFNLTSKTSHSNWVNMISELLDKQELLVLDEDGKSKRKISYNEISKYLNSQKKKVRDFSAKEFNRINSKYTEIAEFEINSVLERKKVSDEYRNIPRPDLTRHIADDISSEVVDKLVQIVSANFNLSKRYYNIKANHLNQKSLGYHERNVPLGKTGKEYEYKDAICLIKRTFKNLDPQFYNIVEKFEEYGHYDVYPKKNKSGGAFCISISKNLPTFILLNHKDKLNDLLTIAHESGHGIHSEMSKVQNSLNTGYPIFLAEIASTFFEDFVLEEILKNADDNLRFSILAEKLNSDISTIFRQVAFYNFEKELHSKFREKGFLNLENISNIFCKHMNSYLGDIVLQDEGMKNGWIYWSHLRSFFYVYSYASGLLISKALQSMVREDRKNIRIIKEFLSSGSSKSPVELFNHMGIDITKKDIWIKGIKEVETLIDKFEEYKYE